MNHNPYNLPSRNYKNSTRDKKIGIPANDIAGKYQDNKFKIKVDKSNISIFRNLLETTNDPELKLMYSRIVERWDRENTEFTLSQSASDRIHKSFNANSF